MGCISTWRILFIIKQLCMNYLLCSFIWKSLVYMCMEILSWCYSKMENYLNVLCEIRMQLRRSTCWSKRLRFSKEASGIDAIIIIIMISVFSQDNFLCFCWNLLTMVTCRYIFGGGAGMMTLNELLLLEKHLEIWIYHIRSAKV